jgi:hypothetical protein
MGWQHPMNGIVFEWKPAVRVAELLWRIKARRFAPAYVDQAIVGRRSEFHQN